MPHNIARTNAQANDFERQLNITSISQIASQCLFQWSSKPSTYTSQWLADGYHNGQPIDVFGGGTVEPWLSENTLGEELIKAQEMELAT